MKKSNETPKSESGEQLKSSVPNFGYACKNEDVEIWRMTKDNYYSHSIHVTKSGDIGIDVGGHVLVAPIERWHDAGNKILAVDPRLKNWRRKLAYWLLGWE